MRSRTEVERLPLLQVLQLRRSGPPRQRMQIAASAQKVPLLPEHRSHGGQLSHQSAADLGRFSGKARPLQGQRRGEERAGFHPAAVASTGALLLGRGPMEVGWGFFCFLFWEVGRVVSTEANQSALIQGITSWIRIRLKQDECLLI